jgi:ABC-type branched-subunit amino acid transport system ATPase component
MLVFESVSVDLAGAPVLRSVSVELKAGTTVAVVGRNGAGKTTFLRTAMVRGDHRVQRQPAAARADDPADAGARRADRWQ